MNHGLIEKYKKALDLCDSNTRLLHYKQLIRETLYKLLQPDYIATIDEVVWAECFIKGNEFSEFYDEIPEEDNNIIILREFNENDWFNYSSCQKFVDNSNPMIGVKRIEEDTFTIIVDNKGIELILSYVNAGKLFSDSYFTKYFIRTSNLHKKFNLAIANEICYVAGKCESRSELLNSLEKQLNIIIDGGVIPYEEA